MWWKAQALLDSKGRIIAEEGDAPWEVDNLLALSLYKALGFTSQTQEDLYDLMEFNRAIPKMKGEAKTAIKTMVRDYLNSGARGELTEKDFHNMARRMRWVTWHFPEPLQREIHMEAWQEVFSQSQNRLNKEAKKAWENFMNYGLTSVPLGQGGMALNKSVFNKEQQ